MPIIDSATLLKLPVYTQSGTRLGKVAGFEMDVEGHQILRYSVRPAGLSARLLRAPLIVSREQVVSITEEKMTVEDAVERAMELEKAKAVGLVGDT